MRFIQKHLKNNWRIILVIALCEIINISLLYHQGLLDEYASGEMYLKYIKEFPASIYDVRVEPLFVILSFLLSKLIGSSVLAIAIIKNIVAIIQLYFFYRISSLSFKDKVLPYLSVIVLNFSFAYFSFSQNLLRNQLGNLFLVIFIFYFLKIISNKKVIFSKLSLTDRNVHFAILSGGLTIYCHILPAIITILSILFFLFFQIAFLYSKKYDVEEKKLSNFILYLTFFPLLIILTKVFSITILYSLLIAVLLLFFLSCYTFFSFSSLTFPTLILSLILLLSLQYYQLPIFTYIFILAMSITLINYFHAITLKIEFEKNKVLAIFKNTSFIVFGILIVQSPYIIRLIKSGADTKDYITNTSNNSALKSISHTSISENLNYAYEQLPTLSLKLFRILFEYRLSSISFFLMLLSFMAIFLVIKKIKNSIYLFIFIFWIIAYLGSKTDLLLGTSVLPYRFSLMLIFPSILLILILIDNFLDLYPNIKIKKIIYSLILISFLATNLPLIFESSILKNYSINQEHNSELYTIYQKQMKQYTSNQTYFFFNGESFSKYDSESMYLANNMIFSSNDELSIIKSFKENSKIIILYDKKKLARSGDDINSKINTNIELYENSKYFKNIGNYITNNINLSAFEFVPDGKSNEKTVLHFNLPQQKNELDHYLVDSENCIQTWIVNIEDNGEMSKINEHIQLTNGELATITYNVANNKTKNIIGITKSNMELLPIIHRKSTHLNIDILNAVKPFSHENISNFRYSLQEYGINKLSLSGNFNGDVFAYSYIDRLHYRLIFGLAGLFIFIIVFFSIYRYNIRVFYNDLQSLKKHVVFIFFTFCIIIIIDFSFFNILFIEWFKKIFSL